MLELGFADTLSDPRHPAGADAAAQAHDAGIEGLLADPLGLALLPVLQLVGEQGMAVDRRQDLCQRHEVPLGKERLERFLRPVVLLRRGDPESAVGRRP